MVSVETTGKYENRFFFVKLRKTLIMCYVLI